MGKSKSTSKRATKKTTKTLGRAKGTERTRVLFAEPPQKVTGNPFMATRVRRELLKAFQAYAKSKKTSTHELLRGFMSKVTGVPVAEEADEGGEE